MIKNIRLLISLPLLIPILIGFSLVIVFGIPFGIIGGKHAWSILDGLVDYLRGV